MFENKKTLKKTLGRPNIYNLSIACLFEKLRSPPYFGQNLRTRIRTRNERDKEEKTVKKKKGTLLIRSTNLNNNYLHYLCYLFVFFSKISHASTGVKQAATTSFDFVFTSHVSHCVMKTATRQHPSTSRGHAQSLPHNNNHHAPTQPHETTRKLRLHAISARKAILAWRLAPDVAHTP